jgi:hypothetical protein
LRLESGCDLHRIGKFYACRREIRHELLGEAFQAELAAAYQPRGTARMDLRWPLVPGCLDAAKAPFAQGGLVAHALDTRVWSIGPLSVVREKGPGALRRPALLSYSSGEPAAPPTVPRT